MIRGGSRTRTGRLTRKQGVLGATVPAYWSFNPAYAEVQTEHVWSTAWNDIMTGGMTPEAAANKAFGRIKEIFSKYPIVESSAEAARPERRSVGTGNPRYSFERHDQAGNRYL